MKNFESSEESPIDIKDSEQSFATTRCQYCRRNLAILASVIYLYGLIPLFEINDSYIDYFSRFFYIIILLMWWAYRTGWSSNSLWFRMIAKILSFFILAIVGIPSVIIILSVFVEYISSYETTYWSEVESTFLCLTLQCLLFIINLFLPRNTTT